MTATGRTNGEPERDLEVRYAARLEAEIARLREQSRNAVEEFKRSFPPPGDEQIERLLYPELSEFTVELGGRRFALRELPALYEKKFLRLVEQKLPALVAEILSFDERLGEPAGSAGETFARILSQAGSALELISDSCVLVLDPVGDAGLTREFIQQHASTARQLRILKAQLLLNGARNFLSRLFPALSAESAGGPNTRVSPAPSVGSNSSASPPAPPLGDSPSGNWP
ncbi:MAG: hypothetical protein HY234_03675 [Acidobacteria bacterium]|nr:hypothetical protein [Acidobacteriota bacterium]MBI3662136.1 hypothetical protein [Acidobacteriota bacterium]